MKDNQKLAVAYIIGAVSVHFFPEVTVALIVAVLGGLFTKFFD